MKDPGFKDAFILVASDKRSDAEMVQELLALHFDNVSTSTNEDTQVSDFDHRPPEILVLAFDSLDKAQRYSLGLHRLSGKMHLQPHRAITLCSKDEVKTAFTLCNTGHFDDYVLFWPLSHDSYRLPMSVTIALRDLAAQRAVKPSAADFATQARSLEGLETALNGQLYEGGRRIEAMARIVAQAQAAVEPLEAEEYMQSLAQTIDSVAQWSREFTQPLQPQLDSARSLIEMAKRVPPAILIVDDDKFQRDLIGAVLKSDKYRVAFAANGIEALDAIGKDTPDLVLMDLRMPQMDGLQTLRNIKGSRGYSKLPVIMVSGKSDGGAVREILKAGAVDFVVKPFERAALLVKVARVLRPTPPASA
ncbi:MAG: response regulator [Betaproteobacteria bacterium]